jgi:hypothetical protein
LVLILAALLIKLAKEYSLWNGQLTEQHGYLTANAFPVFWSIDFIVLQPEN